MFRYWENVCLAAGLALLVACACLLAAPAAAVTPALVADQLELDALPAAGDEARLSLLQVEGEKLVPLATVSAENRCGCWLPGLPAPELATLEADRYFVLLVSPATAEPAATPVCRAASRDSVAWWAEQEPLPVDFLAVVGFDATQPRGQQLRLYQDFSLDRAAVARALEAALSAGR